MISDLHIQNFKCLRDVSLVLSGFNVLIGKNDTGKTSLLQALQVLGQAITAQETAAAIRAESLLTRGATGPIAWSLQLHPAHVPHLGTLRYSLEMQVRGAAVVFGRESLKGSGEFEASREFLPAPVGELARLRDGDQSATPRDASSPLFALFFNDAYRRFPHLWAISRWLSDIAYFRLDPSAIELPSGWRGEKPGPEAARIATDGYGLAAALDEILGMDREAFGAIETQLREAVPNATRLEIRTWRGAQGSQFGKEVHVALSPDLPAIPLREASDGIKYVLVVLALLQSRTPPSILLLEEPENGIHPHQLRRVVEFLRALTRPRPNRIPTQVIVTTHSPYMLDYVSPSEVHVFGRRPNGDTVVAPFHKLPIAESRLKSGMSPGEAWFNLGEDRLLEAVLHANAPAQ